MLNQLSIIIPLAADEDEPLALISQLPQEAELMIVKDQPSRAQAMNIGAQQARGEYLWFLHADSSLDDHVISMLDLAVSADDEVIYYFKLKYQIQSDSPRLMWINSFGANLRSRWCKLPYGDQGLCMKRSVFDGLGQYDEGVPYAEDLEFIIHANQSHVRLCQLDAYIRTSPRKYTKYGWLQTTCKHLYVVVSRLLIHAVGPKVR